MVSQRLCILRASDRIYDVLLALYPPAYRREYGWMMKQAFQDMSRDAYRNQGWLGLAKVWLIVSGDLATSAWCERVSDLRKGLTMRSLRQILYGQLTTPRHDTLGCRVICSILALSVLVLLACRLSAIESSPAEAAAWMG